MNRTHGTPRGRALPALLVAAAAAVGLVATSGGTTPTEVLRGLRAAAAAPSFSLSATRAAIAVPAGGNGTTAVAVTATRGWTGSVAVSVTGLPAGLAAAVTPSSVVLDRTRTVALPAVTVTAAPGAAPGTYPLTVVGTSGGERRTTDLTVVVPAPARVTLAASPARVVTQPAAPAAGTTVTATTSGITATTALGYRVAGLPAGATAAFSAAAVSPAATTTARTVRLTVTTSRTTPLGTYPLTVTATTATGRPVSGSTVVTLVVEAVGRPFVVTGPAAAPRLSPGLSAPLDVTLTNPNPTAIDVTALTVSVTRTSDEAACPAGTHFRTVPLAVAVSVPAGASRTLSQLGVPAGAMPAVRMLDLTTNQDACKGVTLTLAYAGSATGGLR